MEIEWVNKDSDFGLQTRLEDEAKRIEKVFKKYKIELLRILIGESSTFFYLTGDYDSLDPISSDLIKYIQSCSMQASRPVQYFGSDGAEMFI